MAEADGAEVLKLLYIVSQWAVVPVSHARTAHFVRLERKEGRWFAVRGSRPCVLCEAQAVEVFSNMVC